MSKLPNAPLVEVIFRLQWHLKKEELDSYSFLPGDFHQEIKEDFPNRERIIPDGIPIPIYIGKPSHKFTKTDDKYPAIQIGPGILTVNTTDEFYYWEDFSKHIIKAVSGLNSIVSNFSEYNHVHLFLNFIDLIPFDFKSENIYDFLREKLHIQIGQQIFDESETSDINLMFEFENDLGWLNIQITKGRIEDKEGIIIDTTTISKIINSEINDIVDWANEAHELCSSTFKKMTKGELYETFK